MAFLISDFMAVALSSFSVSFATGQETDIDLFTHFPDVVFSLYRTISVSVPALLALWNDLVTVSDAPAVKAKSTNAARIVTVSFFIVFLLFQRP